MFLVRFTPDAQSALIAEFARSNFFVPGVTIHRQGAKAELLRSPDGQPQWSIEPLHPWHAQPCDLCTIDDAIVFDDILVRLALIPRPEELGVEVSIRNESLHVEPLAA